MELGKYSLRNSIENNYANVEVSSLQRSCRCLFVKKKKKKKNRREISMHYVSKNAIRRETQTRDEKLIINLL